MSLGMEFSNANSVHLPPLHTCVKSCAASESPVSAGRSSPWIVVGSPETPTCATARRPTGGGVIV